MTPNEKLFKAIHDQVIDALSSLDGHIREEVNDKFSYGWMGDLPRDEIALMTFDANEFEYVIKQSVIESLMSLVRNFDISFSETSGYAAKTARSWQTRLAEDAEKKIAKEKALAEFNSSLSPEQKAKLDELYAKRP